MRKHNDTLRLSLGCICIASFVSVSEGEITPEDDVCIRQFVERYANAREKLDAETVLACISTNSPVKYYPRSFFEKTESDMKMLEEDKKKWLEQEKLRSALLRTTTTNKFFIYKIDVRGVKGDAVSADVDSLFTVQVGKERIFDGNPVTWHLLREGKQWKIKGYTAPHLDLRQEREDLVDSLKSKLYTSLRRKDAQQFADTVHLITTGRLRDTKTESAWPFLTRVGFEGFKGYFENQEIQKIPAIRISYNPDRSVVMSIGVVNKDDRGKYPLKGYVEIEISVKTIDELRQIGAMKDQKED